MKLTRKQAFDLSIRKWQALAKGEQTPQDIREMHLIANCGLCEKYYRTSNRNFAYCAQCPIRPKINKYDDEFNSGCCQKVHPFEIWFHQKTPENAQEVLALILASRNKRRR